MIGWEILSWFVNLIGGWLCGIFFMTAIVLWFYACLDCEFVRIYGRWGDWSSFLFNGCVGLVVFYLGWLILWSVRGLSVNGWLSTATFWTGVAVCLVTSYHPVMQLISDYFVGLEERRPKKVGEQ